MVIVANKTGQTDGSAYEMLQKVKSPLPIVLVSHSDDFVFNDAILLIDEYILVDFVEHGWDGKLSDMFLFGEELSSRYGDKPEWRKFHEWIYINPPQLYFKRELPAHKKSNKVLPIEYPAVHPIPPAQTKEQFDARLFEVFYCWGLSNPIRPTLHGEIWEGMSKHGYHVCDNLFWVNPFVQHESNPRKWIVANVPHYARFEMQSILEINGSAKLSLAPPGAGRKCFRTTGESPLNSVMVMMEDELSYSFPWVHKENCLKWPQGSDVVHQIVHWLQNENLYEIYLRGIDNCKNYHIDNYIPFLESTIEKYL